jgi:hypothetical protein
MNKNRISLRSSEMEWVNKKLLERSSKEKCTKEDRVRMKTDAIGTLTGEQKKMEKAFSYDPTCFKHVFAIII